MKEEKERRKNGKVDREASKQASKKKKGKKKIQTIWNRHYMAHNA